MKKPHATLLAAMTLVLACPFFAGPALAQRIITTRIVIPWFTGDDAGYSSILFIEDTSMNPWGDTTGSSGKCTVDAYYNGAHVGSGSLGRITAGNVASFTYSQIAAATGLSLANSGQRAQLFLTCNFPNAQAMLGFVNPGGVVTFLPGTIVPQ